MKIMNGLKEIPVSYAFLTSCFTITYLNIKKMYRCFDFSLKKYVPLRLNFK